MAEESEAAGWHFMGPQTLFRLELLLGIFNTGLRAVMLMVGAVVVEDVECNIFRSSTSIRLKVCFGCTCPHVGCSVFPRARPNRRGS